MNRKSKYTRQCFEKKFSVEDPWQFWSSRYEQRKYKRQINLIKKYKPSPRRILEIGCAEGAFVKLLKKVFKKASITGVDISSKAIERAKKKISKAIFVRGDIVKIMDRFPPAKFDVIIISETLYYLGTYLNFLQMYEFLKKLRNLLKKNGILVTTNVFDSPDLSTRVFLVERPIIESYYTLFSGILKLIEKKDYREWKKEVGQKLNYGIRIFRKTNDGRTSKFRNHTPKS